MSQPLRGKVLKAYADIIRAQRAAFKQDINTRTRTMQKVRSEYRQYHLLKIYFKLLILFIWLFIHLFFSWLKTIAFLTRYFIIINNRVFLLILYLLIMNTIINNIYSFFEIHYKYCSFRSS